MPGYLELFRLGKSFPSPRGPHTVVEEFTLNAEQGEFVSLIGHSGCGKSTVLSMIAGLSEPTEGSIAVAAREIEGPGPDRGVVFQSPCLLPWMTSLENVLLGVDRVFPHLSRVQRRELASYYLELVGLADALNRRAKELSQGMQQRVGIARAFAISPKVLLLDEPFGMLDSLTRMELQEVLLDLLERDAKTTVMVTHDVDEALYMSDRIVMMTCGPRATVGGILEVPFPRPRVRDDVLVHPQYYEFRERMIGFLEDQDRKPGHAAPPSDASPAGSTAQPSYPKSAAPPSPTPLPWPEADFARAIRTVMPLLLNDSPPGLGLAPEPAQPLLVQLLADQQALTAVEQFSRVHDRQSQVAPAQALYYRDLVPLTAPGPGEQYAFEVDLDCCTGCKACVTACHNLNGLETEELWREVGLLHGGTSAQPVIQHVTSACHHCLEPACLHGCPVNAYEKNPLTGIVRHLDDQCIGCQYCILKCPYDVPKYSAAKGIVRKCDMCQQRLAVGEAPACVQACPNQAIRISVVNRQVVRDECEANLFLPGAPEPGYTLPTTVYKSKRPLPRNLLPADYYAARASHAHLPLVLMLVFTQMSVGAYAVEQVLRVAISPTAADTHPGVHVAHVVGGWLLGMLGLGASIFHLGRPLYAFRAIVGLRTSWLSREILAFGVFAGAATVTAAVAAARLFWWPDIAPLEGLAGGATVFAGVVGVFCSAMIYADTRRPFWRFDMTAAKFFLTALVLGVATVEMLSLMVAVVSPALNVADVQVGWGRTLGGVLVGGMLAKLGCEGVIFVHLNDHQHTPLRRTAQLLLGDLKQVTQQRLILGVMGGVLLPGLLVAEPMLATRGYHPALLVAMAALSLILALGGELRERYLFFAAVVSPKMPGSPAS